MAKLYLTFDPKKSFAFGGVKISNKDAWDDWIAANQPHFTILSSPYKPYRPLVYGYAEAIYDDPTLPEPPSDVITNYSDRAPTISHGKEWGNRHKTGSILITPWWTYDVTITRKPAVTLVQKPGSGSYFRFQYDFGLGGKARRNGEFPYYNVQGHYSWFYEGVSQEVDPTPYISDDMLLASFPRDPSFDTAMITSALAEANQGYYDLLTELAELPETVGYLGNLVKSGLEITRDFKKKEDVLRKKLAEGILKPLKFVDLLASLWLQYRYAISPLIMSIEDLRHTFNEWHKLFKTTRKGHLMMETVIPNEIGGWVRESYTGTIHDRVFIKRSYDAGDLLQSLTRNLSLNPLSTAWELVPLSFVVDWFLNIGDAISAVTGPSMHAAEVSTLSRKFENFSVTYKAPNSNARIIVSINSYKRIVINPSDHIGLTLDVDLSWKRQLDAFALSWSIFSPKFRRR